MILAGQLADDMAVGRFHAEAEAAANLKHPNIVAIHEVGEHDGQNYFSMDYIEGRNLAEWADGQPVAAIQAATLVKTIAEAIHYAHQRGTLHRDLKPSNILVDNDGEPHVTDFGLAKTIGATGIHANGRHHGNAQLHGARAGFGPPRPNRSPHRRVRAGSDSLRAADWPAAVSVGQPDGVLLKVLEIEPLAPRARIPAIPADLETICLKCLEKSPQRRYHSAHDLAEDLDRFIRREPVHARSASVLRKAASWSRRHPGSLAAATALVVIGLVAIVYLFGRRECFFASSVRHAWPLSAGGHSHRGARHVDHRWQCTRFVSDDSRAAAVREACPQMGRQSV